MADVLPTEIVRRGPGRPPNAAKLANDAPLNLNNRSITSVTFKDAAQFLAVVKSGLNAVADNCDLRLIGPGVYVKFQGREYVVPFANIKHVALEVETPPVGAA